jgi:hypothetical protein
VTLRVRCAWENTAQGLLKKPVTELVKLIVNDKEVSTTLVSKKHANSALLEDHYHFIHLPTLSAGRHTATAIVRMLETRGEVRRTLEFFG